MTTQTVTLAEFLLARIAEDEERRWHTHDGECETWAGARDLPDAMFRSTMPQAVCDCPVPARVLAECEAKRRIVEDFEILDADYRVTRSDATEARRFQALIAVARAAEVFADHPDYQPDWRP